MELAPLLLSTHQNAPASYGGFNPAEGMCQAFAGNGASPEERYRTGVCRLGEGRFGEAALFLESALPQMPDNPELRIFLGVSLSHLGLTGRANIHWWAADQIRRTALSQQLVGQFFTDDNHPERLALLPICTGRGLDVGCGNRKTHPAAIGVDLIPPGSKGTAGCVEGQISVATVVASGDHLPMFADDSLDYVVQRHNLEHYQDFIKAINEWKRVVKPGGMIGMVVPDDETCDTIRLDPTHKHVFTRSSLARVIDLIGGLRILHVGELLRNWSFVCITQKTDNVHAERVPDYQTAVREFERRQIAERMQSYGSIGEPAKANQCRLYLQTR